MLFNATERRRLVHCEHFVEKTSWDSLHLFEDGDIVGVSWEGIRRVGLVSERVGEDWILNFISELIVRGEVRMAKGYHKV